MSGKAIVLDANILIRAVLGKRVRQLLLDHAASVKCFAPDVAYADARKYLPALLEKRGVESSAAMAVLDALESIVRPLEFDLYAGQQQQALQRIAREISAPRSGGDMGTFTNRERVVLRESAVGSPMMLHTRTGTFVDELREVDLDSRRFHLRDVPAVGSVRCVLGNLNAETARKLIGHGVRVTGEYEADADGRPQLMRVETYQVQVGLA